MARRVGSLPICLWTGFLLLTIAGGAAAETAFTVRDPNAAFLDVGARRAALAGMQAAALDALLPPVTDCTEIHRPAPPHGRMILPNYYLNLTDGPIDPRYEAAAQPYVAMWTAVSGRASRYVARGDSRDAGCVLDILEDWARAGALLDYAKDESPQAWFMVEWAAGAAGIALSVVRADPALPPDGVRRVTGWLVQVARKQIAEPTGPVTRCNNHAAWRGLMATAIGVVAADDALFRYGIERYLDLLEQIAADGSLPLEMARKDRALHYQNYAILPLVGIAEFADRQGYDLHAARSRAGRTLHDAVRFLLAGLDDPTTVERLAGTPQTLRSLRPGHGDLAWMEAYRRRFPAAAFERHLPTAPFEPLLGGSAGIYWRAIDAMPR